MSDRKKAIQNLQNSDKPVNYDRIPQEWKLNNLGAKAMELHKMSISHAGSYGVYAGIPIICKGEKCPYIHTCTMTELGIDLEELKGNRCPREVNEMMFLLNKYIIEFKIDMDAAEHMTKITLLKELIDYDIQLRRADHVICVKADYLEDRVVAVDSNGKPIINKEISKHVEFKELLLKRRHDILQLLNATPKDKAATKLEVKVDPSSYAAELMARAIELENSEFTDVEEIMDSDE